jgi:hypothetical protein
MLEVLVSVEIVDDFVAETVVDDYLLNATMDYCIETGIDTSLVS